MHYAVSSVYGYIGEPFDATCEEDDEIGWKLCNGWPGAVDGTCDHLKGLYWRDICCETCSSSGSQVLGAGSIYNHEGPSVASVLTSLGLSVNSTSDLCALPQLLCQTTYYSITVKGDAAVPLAPGVLSNRIGELAHLRELNLQDLHSVTGQLPAAVGNLSGLQQLLVNNVGLVGALPRELGALRSLEYLTITKTQLGGDIDPQMFSSWPGIAVIDLSENQFTGLLPSVDFNKMPNLAMLNVSSNGFSGLGAMVASSSGGTAGEYGTVTVDLSLNKLRHFPEQLRMLWNLEFLSLAHNELTELPLWGYTFNTETGVFYEESIFFVYTSQRMKCEYVCGNETPSWPLLRSAILDGNDFSGIVGSIPEDSSFRRFINLFSYAPRLQKLSCIDCGLAGNIAESMHFTYRYYFAPVRDIAGTATDDCIFKDAFAGLLALSLPGNPGIAFGGQECEVLEAVPFAPGQFETPSSFACSSCGSGSVLPEGAVPPLISSSKCICDASFRVYYEAQSSACGCPDGSFYDTASRQCRRCFEGLDCRWLEASASARRTTELPDVLPGYWGKLPAGAALTAKHVYACYSVDTCVGGSIAVEGTNDTEADAAKLCAFGRTGRGCGACLPGYTGGPDGECVKCTRSPKETQSSMVGVAVAMIPGFWILIALLTSAQGVSTVKKVRTLKVLMRQLLKHAQLLGVIGSINIPWPKGLATMLSWCKVLGVSFGEVLQVGCWSEDNSSVRALTAKWLLPLFIAILAMVSVSLSVVLKRVLQRVGLSRLAKVFPEQLGQGMVFVYMLWTIFFASLTANALEVFACLEQPGGEMTVRTLPDLTCGPGGYAPLAVGGAIAFLVYVVFFLVALRQALQNAFRVMWATGFADRGPFGFVSDSVRATCFDFVLLSAIKDILLSVFAVAFSFNNTMQVVLCAGVAIAWGFYVNGLLPYDTWSGNTIEVFTSVSVGVLLILTGCFGFVTNTSGAETETSDFDEQLLIFLLLVSVFVPAVLISIEFAATVPALHRFIPAGFVAKSVEQLQVDIKKFIDQAKSDDLLQSLVTLDEIEWKQMQKNFGIIQESHRSCWRCCGATALKPVDGDGGMGQARSELRRRLGSIDKVGSGSVRISTMESVLVEGMRNIGRASVRASRQSISSMTGRRDSLEQQDRISASAVAGIQEKEEKAAEEEAKVGTPPRAASDPDVLVTSAGQTTVL